MIHRGNQTQPIQALPNASSTAAPKAHARTVRSVWEGLNGAGDVQVVELPEAIKTVLVRWNRVKFDLADLARLRWIKKMTIPKICQEIGLGRSAVQVSIRTIRNCGISQLNLEDFEKIFVENAINEEIEKFTKEQKNFKLNQVSCEFRKKAL